MKVVEFDQKRFHTDVVVRWEAYGKGRVKLVNRAGIGNGSWYRFLHQGIMRDISSVATICLIFGLNLNNYLVEVNKA